MSENYPIDFVVTWVDGNDPVWQAEKAKYSPSKNADNRNVRFRDWDNMQYWVRAVEKFAPWVNKKHFVTYGHLPKWLNTDNPKLNIVKHSDFIPKEYLPTFSSHSIELNLHRIEGLAERFVYFNDDMFLIRPVKRELFFAGKDCLPTDFAIASTLSVADKKDTVQYVKFNNIVILNTHFDKKEQMKKYFSKWINLEYGWNSLRNLILSGEHHFKCFANNHLAFSYLKTTFIDLWDKEFDELDETCKHKFRNKTDENQWLMRYWQLAKGDFEPIGRHVKGKVYEIYNGVEQNQDLFKSIENQLIPMICINDNENVDFEPMKERIKQAFDKILPEKTAKEIAKIKKKKRKYNKITPNRPTLGARHARTLYPSAGYATRPNRATPWERPRGGTPSGFPVPLSHSCGKPLRLAGQPKAAGSPQRLPRHRSVLPDHWCGHALPTGCTERQHPAHSWRRHRWSARYQFQGRRRRGRFAMDRRIHQWRGVG